MYATDRITCSFEQGSFYGTRNSSNAERYSALKNCCLSNWRKEQIGNLF